MVTWRERAGLLSLVCDVYCDLVTFPFGILGQVWYLIVSIPCSLSYIKRNYLIFIELLYYSSSESDLLVTKEQGGR